MTLRTTTNLGDWNYQNAHVERLMDDSAYTAAHPDDTLVLVGPPRFAGSTAAQLNAVGMLQAFQVTQQRPTVPLQSIGSGRTFFVSGKSSVQFQIGRLFVKGKNLMRALYHNAQTAGVNFSKFSDPAVTPASWTAAADAAAAVGSVNGSGANDANYVANLDSELFLIPFGMQVEFRDKSSNSLGAFYIELAVINSFSVGVNAGQNMILENVTGLADRIMPVAPTQHALPAGAQSSSTISTAIFPPNPA